MEKTITVRQLGARKAEQAVVEAAMAYHYHNPDCQYNFLRRITADGLFLGSWEVAPEAVCRDIPYYQNCRGLVSDVYWDVFRAVLPGTRGVWHPVLNGIGRDMMVMQYGGEEGIANTADYEVFVKELLKAIRPGDVMMTDKNSGSHLMLYLGKCLGDGKRYIIHDWPVNGGSVNLETGVNVREPGGSAWLSTVEELWYPGNGTPHYEFSEATAVFLFRPLQTEALLDMPVPASTMTRLKYSHMCIRKESDVQIYDTVLPGQPLHITVTVASKRDKDFKGVAVSEPIPEEFVLDTASVKINGKKGGTVVTVDGVQTVQWTVDVPAGTEVKLTYTVKVNGENSYPGKKITLPAGMVENVPTRAITYQTGIKKPDKKQLADLKKLTAKKSELPNLSDHFCDLDYVNLFYKNVLGMDAQLPATMDEFLKKTMTLGQFVIHGDWAKKATMLVDAEDGDKRLQDMRIQRYVGGKYIHLDNHLDRAYEYMEEFFTPGDVFMVADGEGNTTAVTDPEKLTIYIYLGGDTVICHRTSGTTRESFAKTVGTSLVKNLVIAIRPTLTVD